MWGDKIESLQDMQSKGMDVPALRQAPVLNPVLSYYYDEFKALARSRAYTHGFPLSIPISEINSHCDFWRLDEAESEELYTYVRIFDDAWLTIRAENAKRESEASKTQTR